MKKQTPNPNVHDTYQMQEHLLFSISLPIAAPYLTLLPLMINFRYVFLLPLLLNILKYISFFAVHFQGKEVCIKPVADIDGAIQTHAFALAFYRSSLPGLFQRVLASGDPPLFIL
jgi:hypothetical protein